MICYKFVETKKVDHKCFDKLISHTQYIILFTKILNKIIRSLKSWFSRKLGQQNFSKIDA